MRLMEALLLWPLLLPASFSVLIFEPCRRRNRSERKDRRCAHVEKNSSNPASTARQARTDRSAPARAWTEQEGADVGVCVGVGVDIGVVGVCTGVRASAGAGTGADGDAAAAVTRGWSSMKYSKAARIRFRSSLKASNSCRPDGVGASSPPIPLPPFFPCGASGARALTSALQAYRYIDEEEKWRANFPTLEVRCGKSDEATASKA